MKPFRSLATLATAISATAALGLAGCIQSEDQATLLADGSGTMSQTVTMDLAKMKELEDLLKAFGGGAGAEGGEGGMDLGKAMEEMLSEKTLREQLKTSPGVEVKKLTSETKEGKRVVNMDLAFADFSSLGKGGFQTTGVELKKNDDGSWTLTFEGLSGGGMPGGAPGAGAPGGEGAEGGMPPGMDMSAMMGMLEPYFGGLSIQRKITVPGTIVSSNGTAGEDGKSVSWKVTWKDIAAGATAKDGKGPGHMTVTFKGDGLTLKPFAYKPDPKEMQKRMEKAGKPGGAEAPKVEPAPVTPTEK
jgi:hypothetical protein